VCASARARATHGRGQAPCLPKHFAGTRPAESWADLDVRDDACLLVCSTRRAFQGRRGMCSTGWRRHTALHGRCSRHISWCCFAPRHLRFALGRRVGAPNRLPTRPTALHHLRDTHTYLTPTTCLGALPTPFPLSAGRRRAAPCNHYAPQRTGPMPARAGYLRGACLRTPPLLHSYHGLAFRMAAAILTWYPRNAA